MAGLVQHCSPASDRACVSHGSEPGISLDPVQGVQVFGAFARKVLDMFLWQRALLAPVGARKLGDPRGFVWAELVVGRPEVIVELAQLSSVPVEAVEVNVRATSTDPGKEVGQPAHGVGRRRYARAATAYAGLAQRLNMPQPLVRGELHRHVGLVWQLGLIEAQDGARAGVADVLVQGRGVDVVPLHGDPFHAVRVGSRAGRPVVEPRDLGPGLGEGECLVLAVVVGGPAEAALRYWRHGVVGRGQRDTWEQRPRWLKMEQASSLATCTR